MSRFTFDRNDLQRVRLAARPAPLVDVWMAVASAQRTCAQLLFADRRRRLRNRLGPDARPLALLATPLGAVPDFLAPACGTMDEGLDAITSTPWDVVSGQLLLPYSSGQDVPDWVRRLADGDRRAWNMLIRALRTTWSRLSEPQGPHTGYAFQAEIATRSSLMVDDGVAAVLESLPYGMWDGRALHNCGDPLAKEYPLSGDGVTLLPSMTWIGSPLLSPAADGSYAIIYAAPEFALHPRQGADRDGLDALIGRTRAAVLRLLAQPLTTSGIACRLGISPSSASEHAKTLRAAGLLVARRVGPEVHHSCTSLGHRLAGR